MKEILKKSTKNLIIWTLAWTGTLAILTFASNQLWDSLILTKIAFVINFAVGIGMIIANKNLINNFDELQRKIHMEAMAMTSCQDMHLCLVQLLQDFLAVMATIESTSPA